MYYYVQLSIFVASMHLFVVEKEWGGYPNSIISQITVNVPRRTINRKINARLSIMSSQGLAVSNLNFFSMLGRVWKTTI